MYVGRGKAGQLDPGQFERIAKALSDPRRFALLEAIGAEVECPFATLCADYQREGQFVHITARRDILDSYAAELVRRVSRGSGQGVRFEKPKTAKGA